MSEPVLMHKAEIFDNERGGFWVHCPCTLNEFYTTKESAEAALMSHDLWFGHRPVIPPWHLRLPGWCQWVMNKGWRFYR